MDRLDTLERRLDRLERLIGRDEEIAPPKLTGQERRIFAVLVRRRNGVGYDLSVRA